jgi:hypothetical protein
MGKESGLATFIKAVNKKYPLEFAVLFGSRARGDALQSSDYDILLVSNAFTGDVFRRISDVLDLWGGKGCVEPICFTLPEFEANLGRYNAIVWESLKDGKVLSGEKNFGKYRARFLDAVRKKEIEITGVIRFNVPPETIFPPAS